MRQILQQQNYLKYKSLITIRNQINSLIKY